MRAGASVYHAGKIGPDGKWLKDRLAKDGVHVEYIAECATPNGHAFIQVDSAGQNAIILFAGANKETTKEEIDRVLKNFNQGDSLLLQNEINLIDYLIEQGHQKGLNVCLNPAPMSEKVLNYPLKLVSTLIVNETEAQALAEEGDYKVALEKLAKLYPNTEIILTVGQEGVLYQYQNQKWNIPACEVQVVDTTGAGDTFIGYYLAAKLENQSIEQCLRYASQAAALCVSRKGAQDSIPWKAEVLES